MHIIGLGTIINSLAIIAGGLIGIFFGNFFSQRIQDTLMKAVGLCVLFIGIAGTMEKMLLIGDGELASTGTMMVITSFALGSLIGETLNIEDRIEQFGEWLKNKTGNGKDSQFVVGFVNTSLTVSIGAMAVVGAIEDGISGDYSYLLLKAILDFLIVIVMTCSLGKGCLFAFIPVACFQGTITLFARVLQPVLTDNAMNSLSMVGSMLIFCIGVNSIWGKKLRVANMLPALVIAVLWTSIGLG